MLSISSTQTHSLNSSIIHIAFCHKKTLNKIKQKVQVHQIMIFFVFFGHTEYHVFAFSSVKNSLNHADRYHQIKKIVCTIFYTNKLESKSEKYVLLIITAIFMINVINPVAKLTKYTFWHPITLYSSVENVPNVSESDLVF